MQLPEKLPLRSNFVPLSLTQPCAPVRCRFPDQRTARCIGPLPIKGSEASNGRPALAAAGGRTGTNRKGRQTKTMSKHRCLCEWQQAHRQWVASATRVASLMDTTLLMQSRLRQRCAASVTRGASVTFWQRLRDSACTSLVSCRRHSRARPPSLCSS